MVPRTIDLGVPTGGPNRCSDLRRSTSVATDASIVHPQGAPMARLTIQESIETVTRLYTVRESRDEVDPEVIHLQHDVDGLPARRLWLQSADANEP